VGLALVGCGSDETPDGPGARSTAAPVASAPALSGRDRANGARFVLRARVLTVTLNRGSRVRGLAGQSVQAACAAQRASGNGVARTVSWPAGSRTLRVRFSGAAGGAPVFCSVDTASLQGRTHHIDAVLT